jgi:hypothetical protein
MAAVVAVPVYLSAEPRLFGFPFFYWYQVIWVVITGLLLVVAYLGITVDERRRRKKVEASANTDSVNGTAWAADEDEEFWA